MASRVNPLLENLIEEASQAKEGGKEEFENPSNDEFPLPTCKSVK